MDTNDHDDITWTSLSRPTGKALIKLCSAKQENERGGSDPDASDDNQRDRRANGSHVDQQLLEPVPGRHEPEQGV